MGRRADRAITSYGFYVLYSGAPAVMDVPKERAVIFTATLVIAVTVVFMITSAVGAGMVGVMG